MSGIMKTTHPHDFEERVIKLLNFDPTAYIPPPEEYVASMSECPHHPRGQRPVTKPSTLAPTKRPQPPLTKRETARLQRLISVIDKPAKSPSRKAAMTLPSKVPTTNPSPVPKPKPKARRQSISSDDSVILTMKIDTPVQPAVPAKSTVVNKPPVIDNPLPVIKPYSAVKPTESSKSESKAIVPAHVHTCETALEWSARMKRYQEEEREYLGLDVIRSHTTQTKTHTVKSRRGSPKLASRGSIDDSLSKQRIEEWLDALSPARTSSASLELSTARESILDLTEMALAHVDLNVCRACGEKCDNKCRDAGVSAGLLIDI